MIKEGRLDWQGYLDSRPVIAEMLATVDIIEIAKTTGCKAHICHVSSPDVAQKIKEAQQEGYDITTPVIVTNTFDYEEVSMLKTGTADVLDKIIAVR